MSYPLKSAINTLACKIEMELCVDSIASFLHLVCMEYVKNCCTSFLTFDCHFVLILVCFSLVEFPVAGYGN